MKSRMLMSMLVIALAAALIGGATMAWFTDTAAVGPVQFTAGTLLIDINNFEMATENVNLDILNPGDDWEYDITVSNVGNKGFNWSFYVCWDEVIGQENLYTQDQDMVDALIARDYGTDPLSDVLEFSIYQIVDGAEVLVMAPQTLENKTSPLKFPAGVLAADGSASYKIYVSFPETAGNEYQGSKMQIGLAAVAWQTTNDAPEPVFECDFDFWSEYNGEE